MAKDTILKFGLHAFYRESPDMTPKISEKGHDRDRKFWVIKW